jgi:hypothetical protein
MSGSTSLNNATDVQALSSGDDCQATIVLTAVSGYDFNGFTTFTVTGSTSVTSATPSTISTADDTLTIVAVFDAQ